jgi:NRPS condensation-like uncharacterized protein
MDRKLGKIETAPALANDFASFNLVGIVKLENAPKPEILRQVLDILQNRHPMLGMRITKIKERYHFESDENLTIPFDVEERISDEQWVITAEEYLNHPLDWRTGPLAHCTYIVDQNEFSKAEIILAFHHSIIDAASLLNFLDELLTLCATIKPGQVVEGYEKMSPLPPVEDMFPSEYKGLSLNLRTIPFMMGQMSGELKAQFQARGGRKAPIKLETRGKILTMCLDESDTTALVTSTRKQKVTINSTLHAALISAVWTHLYKEQSIAFKYILFQNLRPFLDPPLTEKEMGCCIAMLQFFIKMDTNRKFWDLTREINHQVYTAGKTGDKFIASAMTGSFVRMLFKLKAFRMGTSALNYSGVNPLQTSYGSIKVQSVHGFTSNFGLGPEYSAQANMFNGKLCWDILYLDTDMDHSTAQEIADEMHDILIAAGQERK